MAERPSDLTITFLTRGPLAPEKHPKVKSKQPTIFLEILRAHLVVVTDVRLTPLPKRVFSDAHTGFG